MKHYLLDLVAVFAATFVVSIIVTLVWSLLVHRAASVDWESSFRFAILLGVILPWMETRRR